MQNINSCSTSYQSWPLETYTNPYPFSELTNTLDDNISRNDCNTVQVAMIIVALCLIIYLIILLFF